MRPSVTFYNAYFLRENCLPSSKLLSWRVDLEEIGREGAVWLRTGTSGEILCQHGIYSVFHKELYHGIPNFTVWRVLRKRLHIKSYKLSIVQVLEVG
jgi:hypothetical protein